MSVAKLNVSYTGELKIYNCDVLELNVKAMHQSPAEYFLTECGLDLLMYCMRQLSNNNDYSDKKYSTIVVSKLTMLSIRKSVDFFQLNLTFLLNKGKTNHTFL